MPIQTPTLNLRARVQAAAIHLAVSAAVALVAAALVFGLWYPWPYRVVSDGQGMFLLLVSVDIVLGPALTFFVFDLAKGWHHLRRDLAVIGLVQFAALVYGLHTVYVVRPVALAFEVDRFRVIAASDVHLPELPTAPEIYRHLPLTGPWLLGTRATQPGADRNDALFMGLKGIDVGQRPSFWQPYEKSRPDALVKSRPIGLLFKQYPAGKAEIEATLRELKVSVDEARFLPLMARREWVVLLDKTGDVIGFAPFDGFF